MGAQVNFRSDVAGTSASVTKPLRVICGDGLAGNVLLCPAAGYAVGSSA
ncbi:hypothetical protein [Kibdelosporangium philippinense]